MDAGLAAGRLALGALNGVVDGEGRGINGAAAAQFTAGIIPQRLLARHMPRGAELVMFSKIKDDIGLANLVI
jgi:hypothetical protein